MRPNENVLVHDYGGKRFVATRPEQQDHEHGARDVPQEAVPRGEDEGVRSGGKRCTVRGAGIGAWVRTPALWLHKERARP